MSNFESELSPNELAELDAICTAVRGKEYHLLRRLCQQSGSGPFPGRDKCVGRYVVNSRWSEWRGFSTTEVDTTFTFDVVHVPTMPNPPPAPEPKPELDLSPAINAKAWWTHPWDCGCGDCSYPG